ncbi:RNA polymerase sigma factor [Paenisporosarcina sp. TG20]|uniref:RNA polymerase sigma factor n=1 Tax=Paenisporosarcina sp. TG20 TaxID=1211706 RepID=UPI00030C7EE2|nr:sigma-70 family RNA polymerase sigma factor [Paenisporosarcina sp. TG20]
MGELELIEKAQQGDMSAYGDLMNLHHRTVEKFAFQCGVNVDDVQDVTQEVFIKLYRFLHQFHRDRFTTWLYKITLNTARDYYRKENREKDKGNKLQKDTNSIVPSKSAESKVLIFEEDYELHQAIQLLEEKYRIPIILYYFQELTYEQIADVINIPLSTVKTRLLRAKAQLKSTLALKGGAEYGR